MEALTENLAKARTSLAEQREWETLQSMMTARLADKDAWIATLQRPMGEPPSDPEAPVENDTGGA